MTAILLYKILKTKECVITHIWIIHWKCVYKRTGINVFTYESINI